MSIRVTIFEDNNKFRDSLAVLIDGTPGFMLAGAFDDANEADAKVEASQPDVVLMDIQMPGTNGLQALKMVKKRFPQMNVLMQTVFEDEDKIFDAIVNGASGYILKNTPPTRILEAIAETHHGGAPMSPVVAGKVFRLMQERFTAQPVGPEPVPLTTREKEILGLMVEGLSYKMIADRCNISFETVRTHIKNIYVKLHVTTMTEAVVFAVRNKLT